MFRARLALGVALVLLVVGLGALSRAAWDYGAVSDAMTVRPGIVDVGAPPAPVPATIAGSTLVTVRKTGARHWRITTDYRFTLAPADRLLTWLRANSRHFSDVLDHLPGGYAAGHADPSGGVSVPHACSISQPTPTADAVVTAMSTRLVGEDVVPAAVFVFAQDLSEHGRLLTWPTARWTFSYDAPGWSSDIDGRPDAQQASRASLPVAGPSAVQSLALYQPWTRASSGLDPWQGTGPIVLSLLAIAVVAAAAHWLVRTLADQVLPVATRQWWGAAVSATALVLTTATLLVDGRLAQRTRGGSYYLGLDGYGQASAAGLQQQLLAYCWFALPVLFAAAGARLTTGRPPTPRLLTLIVWPALTLLLLQGTAASAPRWFAGALLLVVVACVGAGAVMASGLLGRTGRRWATTAAAAAAATTTGGTALTQLPAWGGDMASDGWSSFGGIAAALVVLPWCVAFLAVGRPLWGTPAATPTGAHAGTPAGTQPGTPGGTQARAHALPLIVLGLCVVAALPWNPADVEEGLSVSMLTDVGGVLPPGQSLQVSVTLLTPAWQIVWIGCGALLLLALRRYGRTARQWPTAARPACVALIWLAATGSVIGAPLVYLARWEGAAAAALALGAALWLLPVGDAARSLRLHRLSRAAHVRLMHSLLVSQLLGAGRQRFLRDSAAGLADGSLTSAAWQARWRALGGTATADPAGDAKRLRDAAFGSSAGFSAWENGRAAAVASGFLALPWMSSLWWHDPLPTGVPDALLAMCGPLMVWAGCGFAYGYLYPWIRGRDPLAKAVCLTAVALPVQLVLAYPGWSGTAAQRAGLGLLLTGQSVLVGLGLGLYWEGRMVRAAGLPWGHLRNFRTLSSLAVPTTTVVVAVLTTLATVFANSWATAVTSPAAHPPAAVSSSSP